MWCNTIAGLTAGMNVVTILLAKWIQHPEGEAIDHAGSDHPHGQSNLRRNQESWSNKVEHRP